MWSWLCVQSSLVGSADAGTSDPYPAIELWRVPDAGTTRRWAGALYTPLGEVMCIPREADHVLFIAPDGGLRTGPSITGGNRYEGAVMTPDGSVLAIPFTGFDIPLLRIDPSSGSGTMEPVLSHTASGGNTSNARFCGAISDVRGIVWLIPYAADQITRYDPDTRTSQLIPLPADAGLQNTNWCAGALLPDGRIFGMPNGNESVLIIDPDDGGVRVRPIVISSFSGFRQITGLVSPTRIIGVPQGFTDVLEFDFTGMASRLTLNLGHFNGGALSPDGRAVFVPEGNNAVVVHRQGGGYWLAGHTVSGGDLFWRGAATGADGRIYACPYQHDEVLVIDPHARLPLPPRALLSPWLNKL